jgi:hypothetical protein
MVCPRALVLKNAKCPNAQVPKKPKKPKKPKREEYFNSPLKRCLLIISSIYSVNGMPKSPSALDPKCPSA